MRLFPRHAFLIASLYLGALIVAPTGVEAQGRFRETGVITTGDMVVWVRATELGEVHLFASKGFRDAFTKPVAIHPDDIEGWPSAYARLAARPRAERDTTEHVAVVESVSLEWRNGRFNRGLVVNVRGARGPLVVQMQETHSREFMAALAEAARLTREMSGGQPRPVLALAARRDVEAEPARVVAAQGVTAHVTEPAEPSRVVTARVTEPAEPARVVVARVMEPAEPARAVTARVTEPVVAKVAEPAIPPAEPPAPRLVTPTASPRPSPATSPNVGGAFAQRAEVTSVALSRNVATTNASPEADHAVLTTKATITAGVSTTPGITRTESTPAAQISKLDASVSAVRSEFPGTVEMGDAGSGDAAAIGTFIRARMHQLQFCYQEHGLKVNPDLAGTIGIAIDVGAQGSIRNVAVTRSSWSGRGSAAVEGCLRERMGQWRLPLEDREQGTYGYVLVFSR